MRNNELFATRAMFVLCLMFGAQLQRLHAQAIDPGFASGDLATFDLFFGSADTADVVTVDSDGNAYVAGRFSSVLNLLGCAVIKVTPSGDLDTAFADNGALFLDPGTAEYYDTCIAMAFDSNGNLIIAGDTQKMDHNSKAFLVVKVDQKGRLVQEFGESGKAIIDITEDGDDAAYAIAIDSHDNIFLAGHTDSLTTTGYDAAVVELDSNGHPVDTFGVGGLARVNLGGVGDAASSLGILPDGSVEFVGTKWISSGVSDTVIVKLTAQGLLDTDFAEGGLVVVDLGEIDSSYTIALDANQNAYLNVGSQIAGEPVFSIVKVDRFGDRVAAFGDNGVSTIDLGRNGFAWMIGFDSSGRLYGSGDSNLDPSAAESAVIEVDPIFGGLVPTFGNAGVFAHPFSVAFDPFSFALDRRGGMYLVGACSLGDFAVSRLLISRPDQVFESGFDS